MSDQSTKVLPFPSAASTAGAALPPSPWLRGDEAAAVSDPARIAEIARLRLDETSGDVVTDALLLGLAERFDLPSAAVNIVLDGAQLELAARGVTGWMAEAGGVPVEWSFCRFVAATGAPFVVEDAGRHPLVRDNPLVRRGALGCYAGAPLVTSGGAAVGALCVHGPRARRFAEGEVAALARWATALTAHLERRTIR